jgi:hypothetical protein
VDIIVAQTPRLNKGVFAGSDAAKVKVCCLDAYRAMTTPTSKVELVMQRGEFRILVSGSSIECAEFVRALFK